MTTRANRSSHSDQRGIALVVVILCLLVLTTLAATIALVTQSQVLTSANYRVVTQARYAAEAGSERAKNWLVYTYTSPSTMTAFDITKYPVQYNGKPVVLSANSAVAANYPDTSIQNAFSHALKDTPVPGTAATTQVTATLLSMQPSVAFLSSNNKAIQTWQITAQGAVSGLPRGTVQVVTEIQNAGGRSVFQNAATAGSNACDSIVLGANAKIDSFDSSAGAYIGSQDNSQGNLQSNGSIIVNGSGVHIYGNVVAAALTSLSCLLQGALGLLNNVVSQLTGNFSVVTQQATYSPPPAPTPAPPTTTANIGTSCAAITGCIKSGSDFTLAPGSYGNIVLSGNNTIHLSSGTYSINSFTLSAGATLVVDSGPVVLNLAGNSLASNAAVVDFSGGSVSNSTGVPANLQVVYGGTRSIKLSGGASADLVVYAPNSQLSLTGGADLYGAFVALKIDDSAGSSIHYDRSLTNLVDSVGSYRATSFSWSKF